MGTADSLDQQAKGKTCSQKKHGKSGIRQVFWKLFHWKRLLG